MLVELGRMAAPVTGMPGGLTLQAQIVANFLRISALPLPIILVPVPDQVYSHMLLLQRCASEKASGSSFSELFNGAWPTDTLNADGALAKHTLTVLYSLVPVLFPFHP